MINVNLSKICKDILIKKIYKYNSPILNKKDHIIISIDVGIVLDKNK